MDKIKYITTYTANAISELTNDKLQEIIDNFFEQNLKKLHHMSPKDESSIPEISEKILPEVNASTTPMPAEDVSVKRLNGNSSDDSSKIGPVAVSTSSVPQVRSSKKSRLPISILPDDPEEKRKFVINKVLERFPYLSLRYRRIMMCLFNSSVPYPICNKDHKGENIEKGIEGQWVVV